MKSLKGYFFIIGATAFWGISATLARFLFTQHVEILILVQMRVMLSCAALLLFFLTTRRDLLRVKVRDLYRFALMGIIGQAGSNFTYYFTIGKTSVSTAILLQYMAPLLVLLYAAITTEERVGIIKISAGILSLTGCFLAVAGKDLSVLNISHAGLITGILSAFCWAFANVWLRRLLKDYSVWTCLVYSFSFATLFWLFVNPPWNIIAASYQARTWWIYLGFAMISVLIPHSLYFSGVKLLTASRAIITATFEPVIAIASAYIFLGEHMAAVQMTGALLVIGAIAILQMQQEGTALT